MYRVLILLISTLLVGCQHTRDTLAPTEIKQALADSIAASPRADAPPLVVPEAVSAELLSELDTDGLTALTAKSSERRYQIAANGVEAKQFFGSLTQGTRYSVAIHPEVQGQIALSLNNATLDEVMTLASELYGYDIQKKGRIYHIYPKGMRTVTIPLNYLFMQRQGVTQTSINTGGMVDQGASTGGSGDGSEQNEEESEGGSEGQIGNNGSRIQTAMKTAYWQELEQGLLSLLGEADGRKVVVSPQSGLVTVHAMPAEIKIIRDYLAQSEQHLQRQVILEAKILEVKLDDGFQQGIDWSNVGGDILGSTRFAFSQASNRVEDSISAVLNGGSTLTLTDGSFSSAITLLQTQGDVNVLSSPRVTALNNQKAVIKVGDDEYFVTEVSTSSDSDNNGDDQFNQRVKVTPFFSGIALDVTPQIDAEGAILLHVHPSVIDVVEQRKRIQLGGNNELPLELPLAKSTIRETDTIVKAKDGEVIVIGGLMKSFKQELISKVPLLGDIPWLGELFTTRSEQISKTELVILLKPSVVNPDTWRQELERSQALLETWYPEAL